VILYHFPTSPFARRVRLVLALKGLSAELRDARAVPEHRAELHRLNPLHTVPLLIDGDRVVGDSTVICHYLERKHPQPPLWPAGMEGAEAFELMALADAATTVLADCGMRYYALHADANFGVVRDAMVGRAQRALDALDGRVARRELGRPLCGDAWSAADIAVFCLVTWLEGLPARAPHFPPAGHLLSLGWSLPPALSAWADQHRSRPDVLALG
jgi:glutathione S-transferase